MRGTPPRAFLSLGLLAALSGALVSQTQPVTGAATLSKPEIFSRDAVALINAERAKENLPPMKARKELTEAATWLAQDMADKAYFAHQDSRGKRVRDRVGERNYKWLMLGENIAAGQETPKAVVEAWAQSEKHRKNMMNPEYTEVGVGYAFKADAPFTHYWVTVFGKPQ